MVTLSVNRARYRATRWRLSPIPCTIAQVPADDDLVAHLVRSTPLTPNEAARVVAEVVAYYGEAVPDYVRRRHAELKRRGLTNDRIFDGSPPSWLPGGSRLRRCPSDSCAASSTDSEKGTRHVRDRRIRGAAGRRPDPLGGAQPPGVPRLRLGGHRRHAPASGLKVRKAKGRVADLGRRPPGALQGRPRHRPHPLGHPRRAHRW